MRLFYRYTTKPAETPQTDSSNQVLASIDNKMNQEAEKTDTQKVEIIDKPVNKPICDPMDQENGKKTYSNHRIRFQYCKNKLYI